MNIKKEIIDQYPTIYPVILVVCNKYVSVKTIQKKYSKPDGTEINDDMLNHMAVTIPCIEKATRKYCLLVKIQYVEGANSAEKKACLVNSIAHEALHVALDTWVTMDEDVCTYNQEPIAYYVGWVSECIYKTIMKK